MSKLVIGGVYKHYKGHFYKVLGVAKHSETLEDLVVYQRIDEAERHFWARPKGKFLEKIVVEGKKVPRFLFIPQK